MKPIFFLFGIVVLSLAAFAQTGTQEFVAQNKDLIAYKRWTLVDVVSGNSDSLKGAHAADMPDTTRTIYIKNNADRTDNGKFPVGTTLVKVYTDKAKKVLGGVAMVKRGGDFNREFGGWEYLVLDKNAQLIARDEQGKQVRGAILKCIQCHVTAQDDHVFTR
jgi:Cytochrome P460